MPALTHIALHVRDLEASVAFYRRFCGLEIVHDRTDAESRARIVWLAEPDVDDFMLVLIPGGGSHPALAGEFSHLGYALPSRASVTAIAERGRAEGCLKWEAQDHPPPVGYFCGLSDPDGNVVEFSYGQPIPVRESRQS